MVVALAALQTTVDVRKVSFLKIALVNHKEQLPSIPPLEVSDGGYLQKNNPILGLAFLLEGRLQFRAFVLSENVTVDLMVVLSVFKTEFCFQFFQ